MVDRNLITKAAVKIAEDISASAIIIMSTEIPPDIDTSIPVLIASPAAFIASGHLLSAEKMSGGTDAAGKLQAISQTIYYKGSKESEHLLDVSAVAFINNLLTGDSVVGIISHGGTASIVVHDLKDNHIVKELKACAERISLDILQAVLIIALDLGAHGREGKPIGTAFILGDSDEVMKRSHQLVLNPFFGHPKEECNIREPSKWETVKEFSQLDGIFLLDNDGYFRAAGRYLDVDARDVATMKGLGGRHASSAAITRDTESIAVTVSQSNGMVRVYRDGIQIMEIDPRISKVSRYR